MKIDAWIATKRRRSNYNCEWFRHLVLKKFNLSKIGETQRYSPMLFFFCFFFTCGTDYLWVESWPLYEKIANDYNTLSNSLRARSKFSNDAILGPNISCKIDQTVVLLKLREKMFSRCLKDIYFNFKSGKLHLAWLKCYRCYNIPEGRTMLKSFPCCIPGLRFENAVNNRSIKIQVRDCLSTHVLWLLEAHRRVVFHS